MDADNELIPTGDSILVPSLSSKEDKEMEKSKGKALENVSAGVGKAIAEIGTGVGKGIASAGAGFGEFEASVGRAIEIRAATPGYIRYLESIERQGNQAVEQEALRVGAYLASLRVQSETRDAVRAALLKATEEGDLSRMMECLRLAVEIIKATPLPYEMLNGESLSTPIQPPNHPSPSQRKSLLEMGENDDSGL